VALARALVVNPSVIIFDETFSSLDQTLKEELFLDLKNILKTENIGFIYIGHIQDEIKRFCDDYITL
jgi:ABC-type molybdate transport system ATPase subunit